MSAVSHFSDATNNPNFGSVNLISKLEFTSFIENKSGANIALFNTRILVCNRKNGQKYR